MRSTMIEFVADNGDICFSIGSTQNMRALVKSSIMKQVIGVLELEHTKEDWTYFAELNQDELLYALRSYFKNNEDKVYYPN